MRARSLWLLLALLWPATAGAVPAIVGVKVAQSSDGDSVTTAAVTMTGSNSLFIGVGLYSAGCALSPTPTDTSGNVYTPYTAWSGASFTWRWYRSVSPAVGAGMTASVTGANCYPVIAFIGASGADVTAPVDQQNGAAASGVTSIQTGSVSPAASNELLLAGVIYADTTALSIDSGFSIGQQLPYQVSGVSNFGVGVATLVQGAAAAVNPRWGWTNANDVATGLLTIKGATSVNTCSSSMMLLGVGCGTSVAPPLAGTIYYVSTAGDDSRSCTTAKNIATPKRTWASGMACLNVGETLMVRGGTYTEQQSAHAGIRLPTMVGTSWSAGGYFLITNYPGETVIVQPPVGTDIGILSDGTQAYVWIKGTGLGIKVDASNINIGAAAEIDQQVGFHPTHVRYDGLELYCTTHNQQQHMIFSMSDVGTGFNEFINSYVHGCGSTDFHHGIYVQQLDTLVQNNEITDFSGYGIQLNNNDLFPSGSSPKRVRVIGNRIHDSRGTTLGQRHGGVILAGGAEDTLVANNLVWNIFYNGVEAIGFKVFNATRTSMFNNTATLTQTIGMQVDTSGSFTNWINNISFGNGTDYSNGGTSTTQTSNLFGVNPLFINAAGANFQLGVGSPAKDAGANLSSTVPTDIIGVARPQCVASDQGAYESTVCP